MIVLTLFSLFFCCFCFILLVSYFLLFGPCRTTAPPLGKRIMIWGGSLALACGVLFACCFNCLFVSSFLFIWFVCLFVWYYMVLLHLLAKRIMICGGSLACGRPSASVPKGDGPPTDITRLSYNQIARILNVS